MTYWTCSWKTLGLTYKDSDWFYYNKAERLLEKSENFLELSVKQLVVQSSLASSISLGHAMFGVGKTKC